MSMQLKQRLEELGYEQLRYIDGRGWCGLMRNMFTTGVYVTMDETGHCGRICFDSWQDAELFLQDWDGVTKPVVGEDGCTAIKTIL